MGRNTQSPELTTVFIKAKLAGRTNHTGTLRVPPALTGPADPYGSWFLRIHRLSDVTPPGADSGGGADPLDYGPYRPTGPFGPYGPTGLAGP